MAWTGALQVFEGPLARSLLAEAGFQRQWDELYARCPWATPFQARNFAHAWYGAYGDLFQPCLIVEAPSGQLRGLLVGAVSVEHGFVFVGAHQAEYQAWISEAEHGNDFMRAAHEAIRCRLRSDLLMRYVPGGTPLAWTEDRAVVQSVPCPLFAADADHVARSMQKKSNKSKLARLRRMGEVRLEVLNSRRDLESILDDITAFYDLRQGALRSVMPFAQDPHKRDYHLALMEAGLLHASVLRVGDRIASALLGVQGDGYVQNGIIAHNPALSKHSPSKLHLLMLAREFVVKTGGVIDLTPGGDPWKDRFATRYATVHTVRLFPSRMRYRVWELKRSIAPAERVARAAMRRLRALAVPGQPTRVPDEDLLCWQVPPEILHGRPEGRELVLASIGDLVAYAAQNAHAASFLETALKRLEDGWTALMDKETRRPCAWIHEGQAAVASCKMSRSGRDAPSTLSAHRIVHILRAAAEMIDTRPIRFEAERFDVAAVRAADELGLLRRQSGAA